MFLRFLLFSMKSSHFVIVFPRLCFDCAFMRFWRSEDSEISTEATFRATFKVFFTLLASFWTSFSVPGSTLGTLWVHFGGKKRLGAPRLSQEPPKRRRPRNKVTHLDTIWSSFFVFLVFIWSKMRFWKVRVFFFNCWVALSTPRDGLICDPYMQAQSKHTFSFLHFCQT